MRVVGCAAAAAPFSFSRFVSAALLSLAVVLSTIPRPVLASTFYYDSDGTAAGNTIGGANLGAATGSFTWDTSANWWDSVSATDTTWSNISTDTAVFNRHLWPDCHWRQRRVRRHSGFRCWWIRNQRRRGALTLGGPAIVNVNGNYNATISAVMNGTSGLNFTGTSGSSLTLNTANTYTGVTTVANGTLILNSALAHRHQPVDHPEWLARHDQRVTIANLNPLNVNGNFTFAGTANMDFGTGAVTLSGSRTINVANNTLTLGGAVGGAGANLTNTLAGTLVLSGIVGTTTGGITVNGGTLQLTNQNNTFTGNLAVNGPTSVLSYAGRCLTQW